MKKYLFALLFVMAVVSFRANESFAQHYYVYDGDSFSVMLTANNANSQIISVQFSLDGQWVDFKIVDFENLEDDTDGGYIYTVLDNHGTKFTVDYYRRQDHIVVQNVNSGDEWKLYRRK